MRQACIRLGGVLLIGSAPVGAWAATLHSFSIPAKPAAEALVDFAGQADISIGNIGACSGQAATLQGRFSVADGLARLLAKTGCGYETVDGGAVNILGRRASPRRTPQAPAAAPIRPKPAPLQPAPAADEVVVTAMRRQLPEARATSSVSVAGAERLNIVGARDARDSVRQVSGVAMTNLGMGRDKILIRGLSDGAFTGRTQSTVGSYLDQTPITYNAPDPDLLLTDIDRVEVLKGPQGALYGGGSLGGVFRIVTRRPVLDEVSALFRVETALSHAAAPGRLYQGVFNAPLGDQAAARIVLYSGVRGGYFQDVNLARSNLGQTRRDGGRAALRLDLHPEWTLDLGGALQEIHSADAQYSTPAASTRFSRRLRSNRVAETHDNQFSQLSATLQGDGAWGRFQSSTAYVHHDFSSRYDASRIISPDTEPDGNLVGIFDEPSQTNMLVEDANLVSPAGPRLQWLAGLFAMRSLEKTLPRLSAIGPVSHKSYALYDETRRDKRDELALYGEISYALTPQWSLAAGGRAFRTMIHTTSDVVAAPPGESRLFEGSTELTGISPKFSISYSAPSGALIYALASQGYRAGGFNTGGLTTPMNRRRFSPDRLWNLELGAKFELLDGRVRVRSALFYNIWKNIQTDQFGPDGLSFTRNIGDGDNWGLEAEIAYQPSSRFHVQVNGLYNRASLDPSMVVPGGLTASALPDVPNGNYNATAVYDWPLAQGRRLRFGAEVAYIGRTWLTFDRLSPTTGAYLNSQLFAELATGRWSLSAILDNPSNSSADTFAYGNPFSLGEARQVTPLRPRTLRLTLSASF
jgi:outer membrane receptor protein involved in Fe transport